MSLAAASPRSSAGRFDIRQTYDLAVAGALGGVFGLYLFVELVGIQNIWVGDALAGLLLGGALGFFLNAAEPLRDGAWLKLAWSGTWGAIAGAAGGALGLVVGELVLGGFRGGLAGRAISWAILGLGIGLSQGLASMSTKRLIYGLIGGGAGGFVGGLLFELLRSSMGSDDRSVRLSQGFGVVILGAGLGLFLAMVEQILRRAWVQVLNGRQEGRAYLLANRRSALGLDEHAAIGIFGDPQVGRRHAEIEQAGADYVLHGLDPARSTRVNGQPVQGPTRLQDGDRIELGQTLLLFRKR